MASAAACLAGDTATDALTPASAAAAATVAPRAGEDARRTLFLPRALRGRGLLSLLLLYWPQLASKS